MLLFPSIPFWTLSLPITAELQHQPLPKEADTKILQAATSLAWYVCEAILTLLLHDDHQNHYYTFIALTACLRTASTIMPHHILNIPTELQFLIIEFAIEDDYNTRTSVYDETPERHFAFEPIPTLGTTSRNLSRLHSSWNCHIQKIVQTRLAAATTAYGPGWEAIAVPDLACGQLCPCGRGMLTSRVVLNEYIECVECNVKRRSIMELQQLLGELNGTLKPREWKRVEQRKARHKWYCDECTKTPDSKFLSTRMRARRR